MRELDTIKKQNDHYQFKMLGDHMPSLSKSASSQSFFKNRLGHQRSGFNYRGDMSASVMMNDTKRTFSPLKNVRSAKMVLYPKQYNQSFYPKSNFERKMQSIEKPYTDLEKNNEKHRENMTSSNFNRKFSQRSFYDRLYDTESKREDAPGKSTMFAQRSKSLVQNLLEKTNQIISSDKNYKLRILELDKKIIEEEIKQEQFFKIATELNKLKDQKPEFLKQFYDEYKQMETSLSETEINSKIEYEHSRLDTKLWAMLEKDRKKKKVII